MSEGVQRWRFLVLVSVVGLYLSATSLCAGFVVGWAITNRVSPTYVVLPPNAVPPATTPAPKSKP